MQFIINSILQWNLENEVKITERVLWIGEELICTININNNDAPCSRLIYEVEEAFKSDDLKILGKDLLITVANEEDIPQKHKEMRDNAWNIIRPLVLQEPQIFQSTFRRKLIREAAIQHHISELSIFGYLKRYWKRGKTPNALLPDYFDCGGRGKVKKVGSTKIGRPRRYTEIAGEGINITEDIKKIFRISINRFYYTKAKNSLVLTFEMMRKEYFAQDYKVEDGLKIPIVAPQREIPTLAQFRYFFLKENNIKREISSRYSNKKFQKQYRSITGNIMSDVIQPGTFEIDCQVADVYIVSRFNRDWVIGRPSLYCCIDKFSRLICGVYVGLESGSYLGAAMALLNVCSDKVAFCKDYGIDIFEEQWPIHHLPQCIIADRGEMEGSGIENLINSLGVKVQNTPPFRADWKASIERFFGLTNERVKPFLPGVVDLDGRERGDADYRLKSMLDLRQFSKIIIKCILFHNNNYYLNHYNREEMMIEDSVPCIPINLFNWGIANRGGTLRSVSEDVAKLALMPRDAATITPKGVKFKDMYYASKSMLKEQIFVRARVKGTWRVTISYDPRNLNFIYVHGNTYNEYEKCFLLDEQSRYTDKTIEEIVYLLEAEKIQRGQSKDSVAQAKIKLITEIEDIVKQAEVDYRKQPGSGESDRQRVKNIRDNKRIEKTANRVKEAFELDKQVPSEEEKRSSELNKIEFSESANAIDMLLQKQKEGLKKTYVDKNT